MAIQISGSVTIQDSKGQKHTINTDDLEFEQSSEERPMGPCITHDGLWEDDGWSVTVSVEEYPMDACNGHIITVDNCTVVTDAIQCSFGSGNED